MLNITSIEENNATDSESLAKRIETVTNLKELIACLPEILRVIAVSATKQDFTKFNLESQRLNIHIPFLIANDEIAFFQISMELPGKEDNCMCPDCQMRRIVEGVIAEAQVIH